MAIVDDRKLGLFNLVAVLETDPMVGLQVSIRDGDEKGTVIWCRNTNDGAEAISMFHHPFAHGFRLPEGVRA